MMEMLRRGATSKLAAFVLFLPLIGAFALWGIGPEWRLGGHTYLAKVGDREIEPEEFDRSFRNELEQISRQAGRPITVEQARLYGLDRRVLARLIGTAALDQEVQGLGLTVPAQGIIDAVRVDPAFAGLGGKFDKRRFDDVIKQAGLTEAGYLAARKRDEVREALTDSLLTGVVPSNLYIDMLNTYRGETRVFDYVAVDPAKAIKLPEPDEAKLNEFYRANSRLFVTAENRKIGALLLTRDALKSRIEVGDEDIKAAYEANKERYNIPEKRHILQMSFPDKAAAEKALPELLKAKDFPAAAVKLGAKAEDLDLGVLSRANMIDPKIAEAVFALKKDEVSQVIEGTFTTVIVKVIEITAGQPKTLADVSSQVKDQLQMQRATAELQAVAGQIEDERSAGKPLNEVAAKFNLEYKDIAAISSTGIGPDGKPAFASPDLAAIAAAAFQGSVGLDPEPVDLADGGTAWVTVLGITPAKERPYDEVKAEVRAAWTEDAMKRELIALTGKLVERLSKGESFEAVAKDAGGKVGNTGAIGRTTSPPGMTASAVQQGFSLPKLSGASAATADGKSRIVFQVAAINKAEPPSPAQSDKLRQELTQDMQSDVLGSFVEGLQKKIGLSVNDAAFQQVLGGRR